MIFEKFLAKFRIELKDFPDWESWTVTTPVLFYPLLSTGLTQEGRKSSRHDWKIVDWDVSIDTNKQKYPFCVPTTDLKQVFFFFI